MPIRASKNQYRGVNAHLHSYLQAEHDWESFHAKHIGDLAEWISKQLPEGYLVNLEKSLQIREIHPDTGRDVTLPIDDDVYLTSAVIYKIQPHARLGLPVTQIEILSPTNKPFNTGFLPYMTKREMLLKSGLNLVEIDYLHETPSPIRGVPSYPAHEPDAYPYAICISNPHPTLEQGKTAVYGIQVDKPIPELILLLLGQETTSLDFGAVYQKSFESVNSFSYSVDYENLPEHFDSYSPADQQRIWKRMLAVQAAVKNGVSLEENVPLPLEEN